MLLNGGCMRKSGLFEEFSNLFENWTYFEVDSVRRRRQETLKSAGNDGKGSVYWSFNEGSIWQWLECYLGGSMAIYWFWGFSHFLVVCAAKKWRFPKAAQTFATDDTGIEKNYNCHFWISRYLKVISWASFRSVPSLALWFPMLRPLSTNFLMYEAWQMMGYCYSSHAGDSSAEADNGSPIPSTVSTDLPPGRNRYCHSPFGLSTVLLATSPDIIGPECVYFICMNESYWQAWSQLPCIAQHSEHSVPSAWRASGSFAYCDLQAEWASVAATIITGYSTNLPEGTEELRGPVFTEPSALL